MHRFKHYAEPAALFTAGATRLLIGLSIAMLARKALGRTASAAKAVHHA